MVIYRELYVTKVLAEDLAEMVLALEANDGGIRYGVLDSSCWHKRGDTGPSIAERMIIKGCRWRPSDRSAGSRVAGKNEIHRRLQSKLMKFIFLGTDVPSNRVLLESTSATHVGVSYWRLKQRGLPKGKPYLLSN